jgi:hypothetical protein
MGADDVPALPVTRRSRVTSSAGNRQAPVVIKPALAVTSSTNAVVSAAACTAVASFARSGPRQIPIRCRPSKDWRSVCRSISIATAEKAWCSPGLKPASFDGAVSLQGHRLPLVDAAERASLTRKVALFLGSHRACKARRVLRRLEFHYLRCATIGGDAVRIVVLVGEQHRSLAQPLGGKVIERERSGGLKHVFASVVVSCATQPVSGQSIFRRSVQRFTAEDATNATNPEHDLIPSERSRSRPPAASASSGKFAERYRARPAPGSPRADARGFRSPDSPGVEAVPACSSGSCAAAGRRNT